MNAEAIADRANRQEHPAGNFSTVAPTPDESVAALPANPVFESETPAHITAFPYPSGKVYTIFAFLPPVSYGVQVQCFVTDSTPAVVWPTTCISPNTCACLPGLGISFHRRQEATKK
jgi:hypothetical protein